MMLLMWKTLSPLAHTALRICAKTGDEMTRGNSGRIHSTTLANRSVTASGGDEGIAFDSGIGSIGESFDIESYKPVITAQAFLGRVHIHGNMHRVDSFNIYMRLKGQFQFRLIDARRNQFPFDDYTPLTRSGVPETRQYMAIGILNGQRVGQPSDVITLTFGG